MMMITIMQVFFGTYENCAMKSSDDKNKIKVGEPNYSVSTVTRR